MKTVEKPWMAFKVMAAGAIPPKNAFRYAFDNGADHILAGMFDYEIAEDVKIAKAAIAAAATRAAVEKLGPRSWVLGLGSRPVQDLSPKAQDLRPVPGTPSWRVPEGVVIGGLELLAQQFHVVVAVVAARPARRRSPAAARRPRPAGSGSARPGAGGGRRQAAPAPLRGRRGNSAPAAAPSWPR